MINSDNKGNAMILAVISLVLLLISAVLEIFEPESAGIFHLMATATIAISVVEIIRD